MLCVCIWGRKGGARSRAKYGGIFTARRSRIALAFVRSTLQFHMSFAVTIQSTFIRECNLAYYSSLCSASVARNGGMFCVFNQYFPSKANYVRFLHKYDTREDPFGDPRARCGINRREAGN
jgi:hypothetical protein